MELVALKVKITYGVKNGKPQMIYPDFNSLGPTVLEGMDWAVYVDKYLVWQYDKKSKLGETDVVNPDLDVQYGCLLVPEGFADAAVAAFPGEVEKMDEAEFEDFYDNRAHAHEPDQVIDADTLNNIRAKYGVTGTLEAEASWDQADKDALDPTHPAPGIINNPNKTYARLKARRGITLKAVAVEI